MRKQIGGTMTMITGIARGMAAEVHGMGAILTAVMGAILTAVMVVILMEGMGAILMADMVVILMAATAAIRKPVMPILLQQLIPRHQLNRRLQHRHTPNIQHTMDIDG